MYISFISVLDANYFMCFYEDHKSNISLAKYLYWPRLFIEIRKAQRTWRPFISYKLAEIAI